MPNLRDHRAGFLLSETLITFAISALVLLGLVSAAALLIRANERSAAMIDAADKFARSLYSLRRDISQLKRVRWAGDEPQHFVFQGGPNTLLFVEDARDRGGGRERRVVTLREIVQGSVTLLMRSEARLTSTAGNLSDLRFGPEIQMFLGTARLRFQYVAETPPGLPPPRPVDRWPMGDSLPVAVLVNAFDSSSRRIVGGYRISIYADGDVGCVDRSSRKPSIAATQNNSSLTNIYKPSDDGSLFSLQARSNAVNPNEFCGRQDRGVDKNSVFGFDKQLH